MKERIQEIAKKLKVKIKIGGDTLSNIQIGEYSFKDLMFIPGKDLDEKIYKLLEKIKNSTKVKTKIVKKAEPKAEPKTPRKRK